MDGRSSLQLKAASQVQLVSPDLMIVTGMQEGQSI